MCTHGAVPLNQKELLRATGLFLLELSLACQGEDDPRPDPGPAGEIIFYQLAWEHWECGKMEHFR